MAYQSGSQVGSRGEEQAEIREEKGQCERGADGTRGHMMVAIYGIAGLLRCSGATGVARTRLTVMVCYAPPNASLSSRRLFLRSSSSPLPQLVPLLFLVVPSVYL